MDLYGQHGLQDLNVYFSKQNKETQTMVDEMTRQCESYQSTTIELEHEQNYLQRQIVSNAHFIARE